MIGRKKINAATINNGKPIEGEYPRQWSVQEGEEVALRKSRWGDDSGDGMQVAEGSMCGAEHSRAKTESMAKAPWTLDRRLIPLLCFMTWYAADV